MKLLDRLVLKDLVPQLLIGIGMFTALYFALGSLVTASRFLSQGIPLSVVARFVVLNVISIIGQVFPMGMLLAVLLGFGRLSADSETVALFAGGIPFLRVAAPAAYLGLLVSGIGYVMNDPIASYADHQIVNMKSDALHMQLDTDKPYDLPETPLNGGFTTTHVEKGFNLRTQVMRQVTITLYNAQGQPSAIFHAQNAHPVNANSDILEYQLDGVDINRLGVNPSYSYWKTLSARQLPKSALSAGPSLVAMLTLLHDDPNALPFNDLRSAVKHLSAAGYARNPDVLGGEVALWMKIALPLASLVFALVGAPLALRPQRTSRVTGWILSLPIIMAYYVLYTVMLSAARGGACPPALAAFTPDLACLLIGGWLVWKRSVG